MSTSDEKLEIMWELLEEIYGDLSTWNIGEDKPKPMPPEPAKEEPTLPDSGRTQNKGASKNPYTWKSTKMKDDPKLWKVVDNKDINVADQFDSQADANQYIDYHKSQYQQPTEEPKPEPEPEPKPEPKPPAEGGTGEQVEGFPIPEGFTTKGSISTAFKFWGRTTCNYASGGSGPSLRWDNRDLPQALNVVAGYEFNIGTKHGKRGDDNVDLKFRGDGHSDQNGGWYIPYIEWNVDGTDAGAGIGKEYPHPKTSHLDFNVTGKGVKVKNIKDGKWHGFLAACYNDSSGKPTISLWYNETASGKMADYKLLGTSKDTGNMKPGPICDIIGKMGSKNQSLQIRMDEVPDAQIRNAFAVEVEPPKA